MDLSIFLAKVIGLYMLIVGMVVLKKPELRSIINELTKEKDLRFVLGLFTLIIGIIMVVSHNIWGGPAYVVVVTLISWVVFLKGIFVVWMGDMAYDNLVAKFSTPSMLTLTGVINLIIGIYLSYIGFFI
jgi:hypothetical protein